MSEATVVVLLSGGLDSTVLLAEAFSRGARPVALSFLYGQRHERAGSQGSGAARTNAGRERIWFSPFSLRPKSSSLDLFAPEVG